MSSIFDMYLKNNIISKCEYFFNDYLQQEGVPDEKLTENELAFIEKQLDYLINMIVRTYNKNEDECDALAEITDKLLGFCIVAKMNESRLCRLLNALNKEN